MKGSLPDQFNLMSKTTLGRSANATKVLLSYAISRFTGIPKHSGMPISISFEPTTSCNLRCPECPSGLRSFSRPTGSLDNELFKNVIDQLADKLSYLIFYFQGEPYLHPDFLKLVNYAASKGIYTATSTNAHFLDSETARETVESGLDRLIISIDGTTQETYQSYRVGGNLEKVLDGTRNITTWKEKLGSKKPRTIFQFLVTKPNQHQIKEMDALKIEYGVDQVVFKTAQIYDFENGSPLIPTIEKYSRYRKNGDGTYHIKNQLLNHCWKMWHSCVITWDGKVVPCCFDKDADHVMGDLRKNSFQEIWKGEAYQQFRATLMKSRDEIDMCRNCTEGTKIFVEG